MDCLRVLCVLSAMLLASGLWVVVEISCISNNSDSFFHKVEVNTLPRSDVRCAGTPKREIQAFRSALAHDYVEASVIGTASGHRVVRSVMVKK